MTDWLEPMLMVIEWHRVMASCLHSIRGLKEPVDCRISLMQCEHSDKDKEGRRILIN